VLVLNPGYEERFLVAFTVSKENPMALSERMTARCDQLFKQFGMKFNGDSYIGGTDDTKDFNVHWTDLQCLNDLDWAVLIEKLQLELDRRNQLKETT
jgi:hypothetical protein